MNQKSQQFYDKAVTHLENGKYKSALRKILKAIDNNPEDYNLRNLHGIILANMGNLKRALVHFKKALRLNPECTDARININATNHGIKILEDYQKDIPTFQHLQCIACGSAEDLSSVMVTQKYGEPRYLGGRRYLEYINVSKELPTCNSDLCNNRIVSLVILRPYRNHLIKWESNWIDYEDWIKIVAFENYDP